MEEEVNDLPEEFTDDTELSGGELSELQETVYLSGMYESWFLDYASYVILERAVPAIDDGLKPVQRRLLHSMKELDDGRYNKVANIVGNTMKYHPHGDASIGDALVQMGQKDLVVDAQGNWGNILTGDSAAAARYIEARLSKFALEVIFNPKTTIWKSSYDGRNKEPVNLPVKFPLLLSQGAEGIAVGLASKILPHNFNELIDACIDKLNGIETLVYPDFLTGGLIDVSRYNDGLRGGRVRVRAKMSQLDKKTLVINEIPYGTTTGSLIDSILAANEKGKIKIRKIDDNTAATVEILVHLVPGVSPDMTMDALYKFTDCEVSVAPNSCVIDNGRPYFLSVSEILQRSAENIRILLQKELEIRKAELLENWHFSSLEKLFIEKKIYRKIEECETWEAVLEAIDKGLAPYKKKFYREITSDDIVRLTEIKIKRISKFDSFKADELIKKIEDEIKFVGNHLENLTSYAIDYLKGIKDHYGKGRERKTEICSFDNIEATAVAAANQKLYVNRLEGFVGTSLRKDEYVCECSDIDDIIVFRENGTYHVVKVADKVFVGENIIHVAVFKKNDERTIYNMVYQDGKRGNIMVKRFAVTGVTRDKEYHATKGNPDSKVFYFTANPNGEAEIINIVLKPKPKLRKLNVEFDFSTIAIKNRNSIGNILSRNPVRKILKKEEGVSTLKARGIWYDDSVKRLNAEGRGLYLGTFEGDDRLLCIYSSGYYKLTNFDLANHFAQDLLIIEKFRPGRIITAVYIESETGLHYAKRFEVEITDKMIEFIVEDEGNRLVHVWTAAFPYVDFSWSKKKSGEKVEVHQQLNDFIGVKSYKAKGKRLFDQPLLDPVFSQDPEPEHEPETAEKLEDLILEENSTDIELDVHQQSDGTPIQMTLDLDI